jgi:hypothetical protein
MITTIARAYRVWIDSDNALPWVEVTEACSGDSGGYFTVTDNPVDESGIQKTQGTLVLVPPPGKEDMYNPWENQGLWAIGNIVRVMISDTSGTLRVHPRSGLRILSKPLPPYPGNWSISVELADIMTWREAYPVQEQGALNENLSAAGISYSGSIADTTSSETKSTMPKSAAVLAGEQAIAGVSVIWQTSSGTTSSTRLNLKPERRLFKHVIGVDDAGRFEPLQNAIRAYSEVQVINPNRTQDEDSSTAEPGGGDGGEDDSQENSQNDAGSVTTKEYVPREQVVEGGGTSEVLASIRTETWKWRGPRFTRSIRESRLRGLCVSEELYTTYAQINGVTLYPPSPFKMIPSLVKEETHTYEGGKEGRLKTIQTQSLQPRGQVLGAFYGKNPPKKGESLPRYLSLIEAESSKTTYQYQSGQGKDTGGQVRKIIQETMRPRGNVAGGANDWVRPNLVQGSSPATPIISERNTDTWIKRGKDNWEHRQVRSKAGQVRSGTIAAFSALATETTVTLSRTGGAQPPAADRRPPVVLPKLPTFRFNIQSPEVRIKTIENEFVDSQEAGEKVAETFAEIHKAREQGFRIISAFRDELFSYSPFTRIDLEYNGYIYLSITDLVTWTLSANEAIVALDCMRVGRLAIARHGADTYPFPSIPPLQPTDPDPSPLPEPDPSNLYPETQVQNILPTAIPIYRLILDHSFEEALFTYHPLGAGQVLPTEQFIADDFFEIIFTEVFVADHSFFEVLITPTDYLFADHSFFEIILAEQSNEIGLVSLWELDDLTWVDTHGTSPLTANGESYFDGNGVPQTGEVTVGVGTDAGCALFDGHSWLSSDSPTLNHSGQSFRVTLSVLLPSTLTTEVEVAIAGIYSSRSQWSVYAFRNSTSEPFHLEFTLGGSDGQVGFIASSLELSADTWYSMRAEFDVTLETVTLTVGNVVDSSETFGAADGSYEEFWLGRNSGLGSEFSPAGVQIDKVKFYIL